MLFIFCEGFFRNLHLYNQSEKEQFDKIMSEIKFKYTNHEFVTSNSGDLYADKKTTRKIANKNMHLINVDRHDRASHWFLKESKEQIMNHIGEFCKEKKIECPSFYGEGLNGYRFTFFGAIDTPTVINVYGGNHLLRFFSNWIYKAGFISKFCTSTIADWLLAAIDERIESIMRFMFLHKDDCLSHPIEGYEKPLS